MAQVFQSLRTFVSSPGDVAEERRLAGETIEGVNRTINDLVGIDFNLVDWRHLVPQTPGLPEERIQDKLCRVVEECDVFILILGRRFGSCEPGHTKSNTEREVDVVLDLLGRKKNIVFLSYFSRLPSNIDAGMQEQLVVQLRQRLASEGVFYKEFATVEEFKEILTHDLYHTALELRLSTKKHKALSRFWTFGVPLHATHPSLYVVYPAMERSFMGPSPASDLWLQRLMPNIVFEDHKGLQKIEKCLRLINFKDFQIQNTTSLPVQAKEVNGVWLCLPRNLVGNERLAQHKETCRFYLTPKSNRAKSLIGWKHSHESSAFIQVHSPLAKYLELQRKEPAPDGEWQRQMGQIVAKDYAVLARFKHKRASQPLAHGKLTDFFFSGIRGLGTWGAAWFVDRRFDHFANLDPDEDVQLLLEVEYRDGRITDVQDVSDRPQSYFNEQNEMRIVTRIVDRFEQRM